MVDRKSKSMSSIKFIDEDFKTLNIDQDDSMVISIEIARNLSQHPLLEDRKLHGRTSRHLRPCGS